MSCGLLGLNASTESQLIDGSLRVGVEVEMVGGGGGGGG